MISTMEESPQGVNKTEKWLQNNGFAAKDNEADSLLTQDGTVNWKGEQADRLKTGGRKVVPLITAAEFAERTAGFGLGHNLITYLFYVKHLHLSDAANMATNVIGASYLTTLLGGYIADTYLGRFWTILCSGVLQALGFSILIINASLDRFKCEDRTCPEAHGLDLAVLYIGLYTVALGTGGVKSSVSAFGADQFDKSCPDEARYMPHFFNWFFFSIMLGSLIGSTVMVYIQNRNWAWGFAALVMTQIVCLFLLVAARPWYRYKKPEGSPFSTLARVTVAAVRNRNLPRPDDRSGFFDDAHHAANLKVRQTDSVRWLDKAAVIPEGKPSPGPWRLSAVKDVEDTKMVFRLLPILATTWFFWTVQAQFATFTVAQAKTANRMLGSFEVPPGSVSVILTVSVIICVVIYDRLFMPFCRRLTGNPSGLTTLQRIGVGLVAPIVAMMCAALVERKRLSIVHDKNLELMPSKPIQSFSWFWFTPQYFFMGLGEVFLYIGQIDFFYNEAPENMQSLGTSFSLSTLAIGYFASTAIVSTVNRASSGWLKDNLNQSRLDLYFWMLAVLSAINLMVYLTVSRHHEYKRTLKFKDTTSTERVADIEHAPQL